jgi:hypothetical protein
MLANFNGLTFFEIFKDNPEFLELLQKYIEGNDLEKKKECDEFG